MLILSSFGGHSFADPAEEDVEKFLGMARIITYTKGSSKTQHYALTNGIEKAVSVGGSLSFYSEYNLLNTGRDPKQYKIVSVEPYTGSNFNFGANAYNAEQIFNEAYKNHFFTPQSGYFETKEDFNFRYAPNTAGNIRIDGFSPTSAGVKVDLSIKLDNWLPYIKDTIMFNKANLPELRKLLAGKNIDSEAATMLSRLETDPLEVLKNQDGYIYFVPFVMTLEKLKEPDIIVYDGKFTHSSGTLCYEYMVKLEGLDKVEKVEIRDNNKAGQVIPLLEKNKPIKISQCVPYPDGKEVEIDIFVNPKKDNPNNEKSYDNNIYQVGKKMDLEVVKINIDKEYPANVEISVPVEVKNHSDKELITTVALTPGTKSKPVRLGPGETNYVVFSYNTPLSGSVTLTAEINPSRDIEEKDYTNNMKSATFTVKKDTPPGPSGPCSASATWTEKDWRWETRYYESCSTGSDGKTTCTTKSYQVQVWYDFVYEATMKTTVNVTDDKGKQKNAVTIKSGYGVKVDTSSSIEVKQISGEWSRAPKQKPSDPKNATVTTSWKVKKIHSQPQVISLVSGGGKTFVTPANPSSETKAKVIYTDIDLKDGTHSMTVRVGGAMIDGKELCNTEVVKIKIKGNMYEDYKVS